ncbi:MAG: HAMP domain-containing protein, partial [Burkholderiales bacterium]|nr:HAMP domain-containing protein [Burkholderiales bacterium]
MHLKIAHQLSLLLAAIVVLAVVSVGGLTVWNLRSGFNDYLRQRDDEQLMRLVKLVERRAASDPQLNWLRQNEREAMRELMDDFYDRPYRPQNPQRFQSPQGPADDHHRGPPEWAPPQAQRPRPAPPPPPPPPGAGPGALRDRVQIHDGQGRWVAGRDQPAHAPKSVRAIKVNQVEVGTVSLVAEPMPDTTDLSFLRRQYMGLGLAALGTVLLALLAGYWLANLWSRPLRALQQASRAIAQGKRDTHVVPTGSLEMAELAADINAMTAELARLETTRRTWIAQISHELRTPLSVLRGEIESIEDGVRQPTPDVMARLRDEVMQLTRLVDDLHTLSVADVDGMACTFAPSLVGTAFDSVVQRFQAQARKAGLALQCLPPANTQQLTAQWDCGRIEQLLSNL